MNNRCEIELTQGKKAIVDKEDFEELSKYNWRFNKDHKGRYGYAITTLNGVRSKEGIG